MSHTPLTGEQRAALAWLHDNAPMTPKKLDSAIGGRDHQHEQG